MDRRILYLLWRRLIINGFAQNVKDTSQRILTYGNGDGSACRDRFHSSHQSVSGTQCNTSHCIITQMLRHLHNQFAAVCGWDSDCFIDLRKFSFAEFDVQDSTDDLRDFSAVYICHLIYSLSS